VKVVIVSGAALEGYQELLPKFLPSPEGKCNIHAMTVADLGRGTVTSEAEGWLSAISRWAS